MVCRKNTRKLSAKQDRKDDFKKQLDEVSAIPGIMAGMNDETLERIGEIINHLEDEGKINLDLLFKHLNMLKAAERFLNDLENKTIDGKSLRPTQKEVALAFFEWLRLNIFKPAMLGHVIKPTGVGKTNTAVMLAEQSNGGMVFLSNNNVDAENAYHAFNNHFKNPGMVGKVYGGKKEIKGKIIISGFGSVEKIPDKKWPEIGLIIVDEADVNGLSEARVAWLRAVSKKYSIPVIAMSATEQQGSGKKIRDVFPDEILRLPMPDSLQKCKDLNLIPDLKFNDLYFDCELKVDVVELIKKGDLDDRMVNALMQSSLWNKMLLDHYLANHKNGERMDQALFIFRDNSLVADLVVQAENRGLKAAMFTGEETDAQLKRILEQFEKSELDMLVGSKLLGRGFNTQKAKVVYNSTVTYSPQIFWQADGRGMRKDETDADKTAILYGVLPSKITNTINGEELKSDQKPICHATFFDPDYFSEDYASANVAISPGVKKCSFTLFDLDTIRSIENVIGHIQTERVNRTYNYDRIKVVSDYLSSLSENNLGYMRVRMIIKRTAAHLNKACQGLLADPRYRPRVAQSPTLDYLDRLSAQAGLMRNEEVECLDQYFEGKNSVVPAKKTLAESARNKLIKSYSRIFKAIAKNIASCDEVAEDLVQEALITLIIAIEGYKPFYKGAFFKHAIGRATAAMVRMKPDLEQNIHIPVNEKSRVAKLEKSLAKFQKERGQDIVLCVEGYATPADIKIKEDILATLKLRTQTERVDLETLEDEEQSPNSYIWAERKEENFPDEMVAKKELAEIAKTVLKTITPRQEKVLKMRFGINQRNNDDSTLEEIGWYFELQRESIRRIEAQGLRLLRHPSRSKLFKPFID